MLIHKALVKAPVIGQFAVEVFLFAQGIHTADANTIGQFSVTAIDRILSILD